MEQANYMYLLCMHKQELFWSVLHIVDTTVAASTVVWNSFYAANLEGVL